MSRQKLLLLMASLIFALLLVACGGPQALPTPVQPTFTPAPVLPAPTLTPVPPTVTPVPAPPTPTPRLPTPTATSTLGVIKGILVEKRTGKPLSGKRVQLVRVNISAEKLELIVRTATDPSATTDSVGAFMIKDISPGDYVLLLSTGGFLEGTMRKPIETTLALTPEAPGFVFIALGTDFGVLESLTSGLPWILQLNPGETLDLNRIPVEQK